MIVCAPRAFQAKASQSAHVAGVLKRQLCLNCTVHKQSTRQPFVEHVASTCNSIHSNVTQDYPLTLGGAPVVAGRNRGVMPSGPSESLL